MRNRANKVEIKAGIGKQVCFIKMSRKITSFFNNKSKENETISDATSLTKPDSTSKGLGKLSSQKKTPERTLKTNTLKKWINEDLAASNAFLWLKHEENNNSQVKLMKCMVCTKFEDKIKHNRDFCNAWIQGTCNLRLSNAKDHAATKCHQHAYDLYVKDLRGNLASNVENPVRSPTNLVNVR